MHSHYKNKLIEIQNKEINHTHSNEKKYPVMTSNKE